MRRGKACAFESSSLDLRGFARFVSLILQVLVWNFGSQEKRLFVNSFGMAGLALWLWLTLRQLHSMKEMLMVLHHADFVVLSLPQLSQFLS